MNLTELQKELRNLENKLSVLQNEIEEMKPKTEESKKQDFENITKLALKYPLENVAISEAPEHLIKKYISLLSLIMLSGEKSYNEKLLYLMRIVSSTEMHWTAEEVVQFGMELDEDEIEPICHEIAEFSQGFISKTKYTFLADALILVNFAGEGSHKEISLIADIAKILNVDRDDLHVISKVVYSYLTDDYTPLEGFIGNGEKTWRGVFKQYIPLSWLEKQRVEVLKSNEKLRRLGFVPDSKRLMPRISSVRKKEILLELKRSTEKWYQPHSWGNKYETKKIFSPKNGLLYYSENMDLIKDEKWNSDAEMYIVSIFDDLSDVNRWMKERKNGIV